VKSRLLLRSIFADHPKPVNVSKFQKLLRPKGGYFAPFLHLLVLCSSCLNHVLERNILAIAKSSRVKQTLCALRRYRWNNFTSEAQPASDIYILGCWSLNHNLNTLAFLDILECFFGVLKLDSSCDQAFNFQPTRRYQVDCCFVRTRTISEHSFDHQFL
jgi:hypothetical protein